MRCQLSRADGSTIPTAYGIPSSDQPRLQISTGDKILNGETIDLVFACTSTLSKMGPDGNTPIITDFISVTYIDECEQPQLYPAIGQNVSLRLYESGLASFISPFSTFSCGPVTSALVFPDNHPVTAPEFYVDQLRGSVVSFPTSRDNIGQYPMRIESCVTIVSSQEYRCVDSEEFVITIEDPCPYT